MIFQKAPAAIKFLWEKKLFIREITFDEIKLKLMELECNPTDQSLAMALKRAEYLRKTSGSGKNSKYIQRYSSKGIVLDEDVLSSKLVAGLGKEFETEINDLKLNYGKSGTCTAFLLRKILEKLIFKTFAKNGLLAHLQDGKGGYVGLQSMLKQATSQKVKGQTFLMPKTEKELQGVKFLGDSSAHNPLVNVEMETIVPVMPFIITAYQEMTKLL
jgi:hypothetical protein